MTGHLTNTTPNAYLDDATDVDAQINTDRDGEMTAKESEIEQEFQSTVARLHGELVRKGKLIEEKDELIAEQGKDLESMKVILKKIGMMANGKVSETNLEGGGREDPKAVKETEQITDREKELQ